jgi:hypothetical protein
MIAYQIHVNLTQLATQLDASEEAQQSAAAREAELRALPAVQALLAPGAVHTNQGYDKVLAEAKELLQQRVAALHANEELAAELHDVQLLALNGSEDDAGRRSFVAVMGKRPTTQVDPAMVWTPPTD